MRTSRRRARFRFVASATVVLAVAVSVLGCVGPEERGPPDLADVEGHLGLTVGYLPEGCQPVGLDGDGRGRMVGAGFDCPEGATVRIERFDEEFIDEPLDAAPTATAPGRVEWRDDSTGDGIRVASDVLDVDVLRRVAESIEIRE